MTYVAILVGSAVTSFYAHHYGEKFFTKNWTRNVRLVFRGYQIHHSTLGALAIAAAFIISNIFATLALFGYAVGNIWQHKKTHNQFQENGMVFITKVPVQNG